MPYAALLMRCSNSPRWPLLFYFLFLFRFAFWKILSKVRKKWKFSYSQFTWAISILYWAKLLKLALIFFCINLSLPTRIGWKKFFLMLKKLSAIADVLRAEELNHLVNALSFCHKLLCSLNLSFLGLSLSFWHETIFTSKRNYEAIT